MTHKTVRSMQNRAMQNRAPRKLDGPMTMRGTSPTTSPLSAALTMPCAASTLNARMRRITCSCSPWCSCSADMDGSAASDSAPVFGSAWSTARASAGRTLCAAQPFGSRGSCFYCQTHQHFDSKSNFCQNPFFGLFWPFLDHKNLAFFPSKLAFSSRH